MTISFSFAPTLLSRLVHLHLATDSERRSTALAHVHLQVSPDRIRFTATDGRLLVALTGATTISATGATDVLLDVDQFTTAMRALAKATSGKGSIAVVIDVGEVRFTRGTTSVLIRRVAVTYPDIDHVFTKPAGLRWVPCVASLDQGLAETARKISGKQSLLFVTPVQTGSPATQIWRPLSARDGNVTVPLADLQPIVRGPAYWPDSELMILLMPVFRAAEESQLDLSGFVLPAAQAHAVAV